MLWHKLGLNGNANAMYAFPKGGITSTSFPDVASSGSLVSLGAVTSILKPSLQVVDVCHVL